MAREYVRPLPRSWWLRKPSYLLFMARELTSVFVAGYAVFLLVLIWRADDAESFSRLFDALDSPGSVVLHLIFLAVVLFHTITWINLLPKVLVLWRGDEQVSPTLVAASNYVAWVVISGVVALLVLS